MRSFIFFFYFYYLCKCQPSVLRGNADFRLAATSFALTPLPVFVENGLKKCWRRKNTPKLPRRTFIASPAVHSEVSMDWFSHLRFFYSIKRRHLAASPVYSVSLISPTLAQLDVGVGGGGGGLSKEGHGRAASATCFKRLASKTCPGAQFSLLDASCCEQSQICITSLLFFFFHTVSIDSSSCRNGDNSDLLNI